MSSANLLDILFPSKCGVCEVPGPNLCEYCRQFLSPYPHEFQRGPIIGFAGTYLSPEVSKLLVAFKDRGQSALVRELAELVEPLVFEIDQLDQVVYLVPAPSRAENFARRGFTPSVLIAKAIAKSASKARVANCLVMGQAVKDQVGLTGAERHANLAGSISLNQKVALRSCFVVDDICTTGSTITEAWRALTVAGANVLGALVVSEGKPPVS